MSRLIMLAAAVSATGLAACAPIYDEQMSQREATRFNDELAGLVPGRAENCLPLSNSATVVAARGRTLLFRDGRTVWATESTGGCSDLANQHYAMVTENYGGSGLCRGSLVKVVDLTAGGVLHGSCALGDFVPYRRP